jgi:Cupin domain
MPAPVHDPVHRATYTFEPDGDNLWVETWLEPGGGLPPHLHPHQEEHWSVVEGAVRFQLGSDKRVIGPDDARYSSSPARSTGSRAPAPRRTCAAKSCRRSTFRNS